MTAQVPPLRLDGELKGDQMAALRDTFQAFDTDGDGTISPQEITSFLRDFGKSLTHAQLDGIMKELDANNNGLIDFDEFVSLMSARSKATGTPLDEESDLREAFKVFDLDGNGTINAEELRSTMRSIRVYLTDDELDLMMKEADEDGNGVIDFQEFRRVILLPTTRQQTQVPLAQN
ncbi:Calmodulin [Leucoagaricus gongylophorus]